MDLKPIAGTKSFENHHLGYAMSGALEVRTDAGDGLIIRGGSVYEIPPGHDAWVVGDEPFVTVEWTSGRLVGVAPEGPGDRVLATVLFTDIVDSTATLEQLGDRAWRELLLAHNARMRDVIGTYRGREVATTGDGFLVVFDGATNAVRCGAAMARAARALGVRIRVGVHTGEVEFIDETLEASPSTQRPGSSRSPARTKSWSRTRRGTSSKARAWPSRTPAATRSRD